MASTTYNVPGRRGPYHPALERRDGVRIGNIRFADGDVLSFSRAATAERDWNGQMGCAAFYGLACCFFLVGILLGALTFRFIIAVVFLGGVALMSAGDVFNTPTVILHRLDIQLRDGCTCAFVDADVRVIDQLAARFLAAGGVED